MYCPNPECPDLEANGQLGEYREEVSTCPKCSSPLVSELPGWAKAAAVSDSDSDQLVSCFTLHDASLVPQVKALLESEGISYFVKNDRIQNLIGGGSMGAGFNLLAGAPEVMVAASSVEQARTLLAEFDRTEQFQSPSGSEPPAGWTQSPSSCAECHKPLETREGDDALTHCYHCGSPLQPA